MIQVEILDFQFKAAIQIFIVFFPLDHIFCYPEAEPAIMLHFLERQHYSETKVGISSTLETTINSTNYTTHVKRQ